MCLLFSCHLLSLMMRICCYVECENKLINISKGDTYQETYKIYILRCNTFFFLNPLKFEALFIVQDYTIVYKIYKKSCRFTNAYQILSFINNKTAGINIYTHIYVGYTNENF